MNQQNNNFANYSWINEPKEWTLHEELDILTEPNTDYWSKTHYGFINHNAPTFVTKIEGDFKFTCKVQTNCQALYDQAGIILFQDKENWIKASSEFHTEEYSTLGSVVTNLGYSDWAFQKIDSKEQQIHYSLTKKGQDFTLEYSLDGQLFHQMRICHFHKEILISQIGVYACSPQQSSFKARFSNPKIETFI